MCHCCDPGHNKPLSRVSRLARRFRLEKKAPPFAEAFDDYEANLFNTLQTKWKKEGRRFSRKEIERIAVGFHETQADFERLLDEPMTADDAARLLVEISEAMAVAFPAAVMTDLRDAVGQAYMHGRKNVPNVDLAAALNIGGPDQNIVEAIRRNEIYWIRSHYDRNLSKRIVDIVNEEVVDKGLGRREAAEMLGLRIPAEFGIGQKESASYWNLVASSVITRAGVYGSIITMHEAGETEYQILSMRLKNTCAYCLEMDGRVFSVADAMDTIDRYQRATTPEEVKAADPWLPGSILKTMFGQPSATFRGMSLPQYHGNCQCVVVPSGKTKVEVVVGENVDYETQMYADNLTTTEWGNKVDNLQPGRYDPSQLKRDFENVSIPEKHKDMYTDKAGVLSQYKYAKVAREAAANANRLFFKMEDGKPSFFFVNEKLGTITRGNGSFVWGHEHVSNMKSAISELTRTALRIPRPRA